MGHGFRLSTTVVFDVRRFEMIDVQVQTGEVEVTTTWETVGYKIDEATGEQVPRKVKRETSKPKMKAEKRLRWVG